MILWLIVLSLAVLAEAAFIRSLVLGQIRLDAHLLPSLPAGDQPAQLQEAYRTAAKRVDDPPVHPTDPWKDSTTREGFALVGGNHNNHDEVYFKLEKAIQEQGLRYPSVKIHRAKLVIGPEVTVRAD